MTQKQEFKLLQSHKEFEIREYFPCVIAEVKISAAYSTAMSSAFSSLFSYISQGNKSAQKIAMTAPVIATQKSDNSEHNDWFVSFVMPSDSTFDLMPLPNDSRVTLRELGAETCVVKSFRGKATDELSRKMIQDLRTSASKANIALSAESRICRFDPPLKPGFLQYNEIVIPINLEK